jgi:hypothetical protein
VLLFYAGSVFFFCGHQYRVYCSLVSLRETSKELGDLTRTSAVAYADFAKEFTVAARVARGVRRDLDIASRRIE